MVKYHCIDKLGGGGKLIMKFMESIEYRNIDRVSFWSGVCGIGSFFLALIGFICDLFNVNIHLFGINFTIFAIICSLLLFILVLIIRVFKTIKSKEEFKKATEYVNDAVQIYMDTNFKLVKTHNKKELSLSYLTDMVNKECEDILELLCRLFKRVTGERISACIKLIADDCQSTQTFYRSKNTQKNRENRVKNKNPKFSENTDFDKIINGNEEYFYVTDLKKYKQTHEYRNSNEHIDVYNGTIVVPIKIKNEFIHFSTEKSNEYNLLGFLCVDSKSNRAFTQRQMKYNLQIMFIFANIFYMILNKYKYYLKKYKNEYERKG